MAVHMSTLDGRAAEAAHLRSSGRRIQEINIQNDLKERPVYVDAVRKWPTKIRCFQAGSCHMFMDPPALDRIGSWVESPLAALGIFAAPMHAVGRYLGLQRGWFQSAGQAMPHYDWRLSPDNK